MKSAILSIIFAIVGSQLGTAQAKESLPSQNWMDDVKWGTMTHYLSDWVVRDRPSWQGGERLPASRVLKGPMTPEKWSKLVDDFDVEAFANQLKEVGTDYHIMTVGQTSGYYLSPNKAYDEIIGRATKNSRFPKRDLIHEIGKALKKRGIRFVIYIPIEEPLRGDKEASRKLRPAGQVINGKKINGEEAGRIFIKNWSKVLDEYAQRWGDTVDGWWFDGCWQGKMSYKDEPNWGTIIKILKKANPNTLVSFNHQYRNLRGLKPPHEDFFAGETNNPQAFFAMSKTREDGARSQMLTYLGYTWYYGNRPRFSVADAQKITRNMTRYGGTITWDIAITPDGKLLDSYIPTLKAIDEAANEDLWESWKKRSGGKVLPTGNVAYQKPAYLLSNEEGKGQHGLFAKALPVNGGKHFARNGVDNDPDTQARAAGEWAWSYAVDLIRETKVKRINLAFGKNAFATHYTVELSKDGLHWTTVHEVKQGDGSPLKLTLPKSIEARWVKVKALTPNKENQKGEQMAVSELQVFQN